MLDIMQDPDFIADLQRQADADHARQSVCSWCGRPGEPYEHNGVRFDGLTACQGDRLCKRCSDSYLENTPGQGMPDSRRPGRALRPQPQDVGLERGEHPRVQG